METDDVTDNIDAVNRSPLMANVVSRSTVPLSPGW
jgi:hypothetical protein